jgi:hypothetical protein
VNIKSFKKQFKIFWNSEIPVNFGCPNDAHLILDKPLEIKIKEKRIELYETKAESSYLTAKQLFDYVKSLKKDYDEFELFFRCGGGGWAVEYVSPRPKNGVVYLDCNTEITPS